jgi:hypothetical protein
MTDKNALVRAEDAKLGPAMRALPNDRMREFVRILVQTGCGAAKAGEAAGYDVGRSDGHVRRLVHDERVQAAIQEEGIKAIRAHSAAGIRILAEIAGNPNEAARDRIAAVRELMQRGGFHATTEHNVTVTHRSESEIDAELLALATEMGFTDEQKARLVGRPVVRKVTEAIVIDNEPLSVDPSQDTLEGIEDLVLPSEPLGHESGIESDEDPTLDEQENSNEWHTSAPTRRGAYQSRSR